MKKSLALISLAALAITCAAQAADYGIDNAHTSIGFTIRHMVGRVNGNFKDFDGNFSFDPKKVSEDKADFTVNLASINTENAKRDAHLRSPDFFDVKKYPKMTFKSTKVIPEGQDKYKLVGDLTLHGVTRQETFDVEFGGTVKDPWGNMRAGFTATTTLNRKNYGIIWNKTLDQGSLMLGDDVNVVIQVEAVEKPASSKKM